LPKSDGVNNLPAPLLCTATEPESTTICGAGRLNFPVRSGRQEGVSTLFVELAIPPRQNAESRRGAICMARIKYKRPVKHRYFSSSAKSFAPGSYKRNDMIFIWGAPSRWLVVGRPCPLLGRAAIRMALGGAVIAAAMPFYIFYNLFPFAPPSIILNIFRQSARSAVGSYSTPAP